MNSYTWKLIIFLIVSFVGTFFLMYYLRPNLMVSAVLATGISFLLQLIFNKFFDFDNGDHDGK